ncbi:hypothetical protein [Leifsonia sp. Leaf264]|uniref:hypothetical protein n=1 Tax=Leifsonia sp. Leaf264 TaxID=1736314 RepID=UPI0006F52F72|nr:hypothetical protein [Leifsonia sp. Leaf264]KQO98376.1 hypothetical protein ASF30_09965 [Leifsonia sp. Leaf264]
MRISKTDIFISIGLLAIVSVCLVPAIALLNRHDVPTDLFSQSVRWFGITVGFLPLFIVGGGFFIQARNKRFLRAQQAIRFEVDSNLSFLRFERPVKYRGLLNPALGDEALTDTVPLPEVRYATWSISIFSRVAPHYLQFWDRDPGMEMGFLGTDATNKDANLFAKIDLDDLNLYPTVKQDVIQYLTQRSEQGMFSANVNLETAAPLTENLPPLATGVRFEGKNVVYDLSAAAQNS